MHPEAAQSSPGRSRPARADSSTNGHSSTASQRASASLLRPGHTPIPQKRRWHNTPSNSSRSKESRKDRSAQHGPHRCVFKLPHSPLPWGWEQTHQCAIWWPAHSSKCIVQACVISTLSYASHQ